MKLSQRPFQQSNIESRESITRDSNKSRSGLVSLTGIECENRDANIENRVSILDSILDSCEDRESSVNLLLNGTITNKM